MFLCKFCNQERKNANSLRNHERMCKCNPNRQASAFSDPGVILRKERSNGAIKAKKLGLTHVVSIETRRKIGNLTSSRSSEWNAVNGEKISKAVKARVEAGTWHTSLAKHMHINYNGVDLHGSWELEYAKYLDANKIKWQRCSESFTYTYNGKIRRYTPDFYLVDTDEYVEIKGYKTEKDSAKWDQFPKHRTLTVLMKNELLELGLPIKT